MDSDENAIANVISILIVIGMIVWLFVEYWNNMEILVNMVMHWGVYAIVSITFVLIVLWWTGNLPSSKR